MMSQFIDPAEVPGLLAEQAREEERRRMALEDMSNRWCRLIAEELTPEQLQAVQWALGVISNSGDGAQAIANYYEGMASSAAAVRRIRLGEELLRSEDDGGKHTFVTSGEPGDPFCSVEGCGLPVFNRRHL